MPSRESEFDKLRNRYDAYIALKGWPLTALQGLARRLGVEDLDMIKRDKDNLIEEILNEKFGEAKWSAKKNLYAANKQKAVDIGKKMLDSGKEFHVVRKALWKKYKAELGDGEELWSFMEGVMKRLAQYQRDVIDHLDSASKRSLSALPLVEVQKVWDGLATGKRLATGSYYKRAVLLKEISKVRGDPLPNEPAPLWVTRFIGLAAESRRLGLWAERDLVDLTSGQRSSIKKSMATINKALLVIKSVMRSAATTKRAELTEALRRVS